MLFRLIGCVPCTTFSVSVSGLPLPFGVLMFIREPQAEECDSAQPSSAKLRSLSPYGEEVLALLADARLGTFFRATARVRDTMGPHMIAPDLGVRTESLSYSCKSLETAWRDV